MDNDAAVGVGEVGCCDSSAVVVAVAVVVDEDVDESNWTHGRQWYLMNVHRDLSSR